MYQWTVELWEIPIRDHPQSQSGNLLEIGLLSGDCYEVCKRLSACSVRIVNKRLY